jgi:dihydrofolate reductase
MRTVVFGGATTLDNFLARPDGSVDWILWGNEAAEIMAKYWRRFDAIVMGRKTYEFALRMGQSGGYPGMKTVVFSRTLQSKDSGDVEIVSADAVDFVRRLKSEEGKDICVMGGGILAKSLFEADLIDEIGFNIHPVLLGSGIPLFYEMSHQFNLELLECRPFKNGCVLVTYRVQH